MTPTAGNEKVALSWTAPATTGGSAITGYDVFQGTSPGSESGTPVNGSTLIAGTTYTVHGLTNGTTYYFTVKAVNKTGTSVASSEVTATPAVASAAPANLRGTIGNARVTLAWTAPATDGGSAVKGYDVFKGTSPGGESGTPVNGATLVAGTSYKVSGLTNGTEYYFTVKAVNGVRSSGPSNEAGLAPTRRSPARPRTPRPPAARRRSA